MQGFQFYRHRLPVRIMHWINVVSFFLMLMSGLGIFNAHPHLYWGAQSHFSAPLLSIEGGFPSWATIPGWKSLATARNWHLFFAWIFVLNGLSYVAYTLFSGHLRRDLLPRQAELRGFKRSLKDHLLLRHPTGQAARRYNVLQNLAYLAVIFVLLPLLVLAGLGMSPRLDSLYGGWVGILGGRQSARTLHFIAAFSLLAFVIVHVFEVLVSGLWNNLRSMITGYYRLPPAENEREHEGRAP